MRDRQHQIADRAEQRRQTRDQADEQQRLWEQLPASDRAAITADNQLSGLQQAARDRDGGR